MQTFTGREYLLIDIANNLGLDREEWSTRLEWVQDNMDDLEYIKTAKHPILYRKAVRALRTVQRGQPTNHIMGLDATASGLQIMACLSGCHKTGFEVNLVNDGIRHDVYGSIGDYMNVTLSRDRPFTRDDMKDPLMTTFYGSTAQPKKIFGDGTPELHCYYDVLKERMPGAVATLNVIQSFWQPNVTHHEWTLADNHTAYVPVTGTAEKNLEIDELNHLRMTYRTQVLGTRSQSRALAANVVHSVDAWVCRQMILMAKKQGFWLAPIHDCFYTSPKYMNQVRKNYMTLLAWIADNPVLENILRNISNKPVIIRKGSNNLSKAILEAEYPLS
jgi:DNA-directed RNA polymerase